MPNKVRHHRRITYAAGKRAEWLALVYLLCKGYRLLARRYKCPAGEVDLIVARRSLVVFVEVKYRGDRDVAAFSITPKQQSRIIRAAQYWTLKNQRDGPQQMRFDAILLAPWRWPLHIENAFVDMTG